MYITKEDNNVCPLLRSKTEFHGHHGRMFPVIKQASRLRNVTPPQRYKTIFGFCICLHWFELFLDVCRNNYICRYPTSPWATGGLEVVTGKLPLSLPSPRALDPAPLEQCILRKKITTSALYCAQKQNSMATTEECSPLSSKLRDCGM